MMNRYPADGHEMIVRVTDYLQLSIPQKIHKHLSSTWNQEDGKVKGTESHAFDDHEMIDGVDLGILHLSVHGNGICLDTHCLLENGRVKGREYFAYENY